MIAHLHGTLREKEPTRVVVDCRGTGYEVGVPLSTSVRLPNVGDPVDLHIITRFTQTGVELYGFAEKDERDVFALLLSVRGIGPRAGLNFLSRFAPDEILRHIKAGRVEVIQSVPGIGPKKAERVLAELAEQAVTDRPELPVLAEAEEALISLGLTRREARTRLEKVEVNDRTNLQELLRRVLQVGQG